MIFMANQLVKLIALRIISGAKVPFSCLANKGYFKFAKINKLFFVCCPVLMMMSGNDVVRLR